MKCSTCGRENRGTRAARLYRTARTRGVTVRSSVDCLIAARALPHDLEVLHRDGDFDAIARVYPLRQRRG
jgi:predicted nucleic acid-binding protein